MASTHFTVLSLLLYLVTFAACQISRASWTVTVDSEEPGAGNQAVKALDGNTSTFWHTQWQSANPGFPHTFTIDMKSTYPVNAFSYLPRQDASSNGNIGSHKIELSTDGSTWSMAATGTWWDSKTEKRVQFTSRQARYVRLTALSEAGGRGPWSSMAEVNMYAASSYTAPPTSKGRWEYTLDLPIVPASIANIGTSGQVLMWSAFRPDQFGGGTGITYTSIWDPKTQAVSQRVVTNTGHDMFCPGISLDGSGRPFVTGGNDAAKLSIYDPVGSAWTAGAPMQIPRGYHSSATCSDGRVFTIGGSWSGGQGNKNGEIYTPSSNSWALLSGAQVAPMLTADAQGIYRADNHAHLFGWKNRYVFQAGPSKAMNWYSTSGSGAVTSAGSRAGDADAMCGNAVMFDAVAGKILAMGGSPSYQNTYATKKSYVITLGTPGGQVSTSTTPSMSQARAFANAVVLPDGKVFVSGGQSYPVPFSDDTATLIPELYDPATNTWTQMNPHAIPRTYHSTAILLPDATVFNGGGGLCGTCSTNHFDAEIFSPPYLFNSDGSRATRPVISSVSSTSFRPGSTITVKTTGAVSAFSLVRYGSSTHTVNTDQRRVPLGKGTSTGTNTYSLSIPGDSGVVLPGYWMLFALNDRGVPSEAKIVLVSV